MVRKTGLEAEEENETERKKGEKKKKGDETQGGNVEGRVSERY